MNHKSDRSCIGFFGNIFNMEVVQNCFWELAVLSQQDDPQVCSDFELGIGTLLRGGVFNTIF